MRPNVLRRGLAAALVILAACSQPASQRVRSSGAVTQRLLAGGGRVVHDYGSFQVVEAEPSALAALDRDEAVVLDGRILLNAGPFDPNATHTLATRSLAIPTEGRRLNLIQFAGPVRPEWHDALAATGVRIVSYIPNDAYLVWGDAASLGALGGMAKSSATVRWAGAYLDSDKLDPSALTTDPGAWSVQLVEDPEVNASTLASVARLERGVTRVSAELGYVNLVVHCDAAAAASLSTLPDVVSIQPYVEPIKGCERQAMIVSGHVSGNAPSSPGYLAWLASKGFTQAQFDASAFGVDVSDSGIDNGSATPNHFGLYVGGDVANASRIAYNRLEGTAHLGSTLQACDGHGNLNAHIVAGYASLGDAVHSDASGYRYGMGIAPYVRVGSSVVFDPDTFTSPDFEDLQSRAWAAGMRISTNSWGARTGGAYTADCQRYDALVRDAAPTGSALPLAGNQEMTIVFSAGNSGSSANTVGSPGSAKNVITIGGSEGVQAMSAADGCGIADDEANSFNDVVAFSSRGPTDDGRRKPDLVAPASHVSGGVAQASGQRANPPGVAAGSALSCFDASGVCGATGSGFFPAAQQWYTVSSGTSHSAPAVAGAAALVRQYFINQGWGAPSPAMTKAYLMNAARYLVGAGANDTLPSNSQGMGLLDLGMAFDGLGRLLVDQDPANLFTATGQAYTLEGYVAAGEAPFRVTLAWTDAPGSTTGAAYKNNLDLTVTVGGVTYRGNVFSGRVSVAGGTADAVNNVESVFLPAGVTGPFTVTVTAANVNSDGVPGNASLLDQDFALVVYGACTTPPPGVPGGVTATATADNRVEVSWTANGSEEYRVYRSGTAGGPYTRVGVVAAPPFVDTTVSGGSTYHYVVRAAVCAESANSEEASVLATGACNLPPTFAGATGAVSNGTATCGNTVSWSPATPACGGALTYSVYRSPTAGFTPGVANRIASGATGTSFLDDLNLKSGVTYHYVVRATETAAATVTDGNTVTRSVAVHGGQAAGFFDDFDANRPANAAAYWIATTQAGTPGTSNLTNACRYQSPTWAYRTGGAATSACGGTYPASTQTTLSLGGNGTVAGVNGFAVPAGGTLTFSQWYSLEYAWDGVWLVYSTTSAAGPWTAVPDAATTGQPWITAGGYDGTLVGSSTRVWTGDRLPANGALRQVTVNLDALAGRTAWFAWKFFSDTIISREGFYLDDVRVSALEACATHVPPPGPAASFALTLPPTMGAGVPAAVTVTALDAVGLTAGGYSGPANLASSDPQAVLPSPITFSAGVATTSVELRSLGSRTVTVSDQAAPEVTGGATTSVIAGPPAALAFGVQPQSAVAGAAIAPAVTVRVLDAFGNPTAATAPVTIALGANPGGDTLDGTLTVNAVNGVAIFPGLVLRKAAAGYTLRATSGAWVGATSASFTVAPAPASYLEFAQDASTTVAGDAITPAPAIAVRDPFGNLVTGSTATVTVSLTANPSAGTLGGTLSVPAVGGVATFPDLWVDAVGDGYRLGASSATLASATGAGFSVTHAAADRVVFVQQPTDIVAGEAPAPAVSVAVLDRFGNLATGWVGNVSLGIAVNPTSAALAGTTTETAVAGVATFPDVSLQVAGTWYRLAASAALLAGDVSIPFHVRPGAVAGLTFATQPGGSVAGEAVAGRPSVHLVDAFGNRQPDAAATVTVALGDNPGADSLGGTVAVDTVAGAATFTQLVLDAAADGYTLVASSGGFTVESAGFDVHAAAPAALEFVAAPAATAALAPLTPAPAVRVRDTFGNTVSGPPAAVTLSLASNPSSGTLSGKTAVATVSGLAAFHGLSVDKAGSAYTLSATADGLPPVVSDAFDVTAAPAPPPAGGDGGGGCGCSGGGSGELGLMLGLAALGRAAIAPRRRRAA